MCVPKFVFIFLLLLPVFSIGQVKSIGTPYIQNYPKSVYKAGTQNWGIAQDDNGFMYYANNNGLLRFDGFHWVLIDGVPEGMVRSVMVDSRNRIFVGLLYDFGIVEQDETGKYTYKSLLDRVPEDKREFNDVWKIHEINENIVFQTYERMFIYDGQEFDVIEPKNQFEFSFNVNGRLLVQDRGVGIFEVFNSFIDKVPWAESLKDYNVLTILEIAENHLLIGTANHGFFYYDHGVLQPWDTEVNTFIKENKLFSATTVLGNHLAFGTILNGVIIANIDGEIIQHLNREKGLQNNTILSVFTDKNKNLWLGLDSGIDYVEINSPISYIGIQGHVGTGYCAKVFEDKLYVGTNQGLFVRPFYNFSQRNDDFSLVENTAGQVWSLEVYNDQLVCGHNLGTYIIKNDKVRKISDEPGAWGYIKLKNNPDILLGGHYNGLLTLKDTREGWKVASKVKGYSESSRFLNQDDNGDIWMSHGGKGIFRMELNKTVDSVRSVSIYGKGNGLPSNKQNILFNVQGNTYASTINGSYVFNYDKNSFEKADDIDKLFGFVDRLKTVVSDKGDNIWYISDKEFGVLRRNEDLSYTKITSPFEALTGHFVSEFEFVYPIDNDHVFFGIDNGFAHYSTKFTKSYREDYKAYITKAELVYLDTTVYPMGNSESPLEFPFRKNSIRFHYTAPFYESVNELKFSYLLDNYSESWSAWSHDIYNDFTNLPYGKYRFKVKAINKYGVESSTHEFAFTILPPWYRTKIAHVVYVILALLLLFGTILVVKLRIRRSQELAKQKHEKEIRKQEEVFQHQAVVSEKEIIKLRNDKLRAEMIHRDKELANQTNSIIQKNKFLRKLNDELKLLQNSTDDTSVRTKIAIIKKRISKETENKQHKVFETYFDEVHEVFFERLKKKFPQLSPKDLRLCAYIKMNISTKEIATLLNISDRGVEITRYRLRKKLELSREINLSTFLAGI